MRTARADREEGDNACYSIILALPAARSTDNENVKRSANGNANTSAGSTPSIEKSNAINKGRDKEESLAEAMERLKEQRRIGRNRRKRSENFVSGSCYNQNQSLLKNNKGDEIDFPSSVGVDESRIKSETAPEIANYGTPTIKRKRNEGDSLLETGMPNCEDPENTVRLDGSGYEEIPLEICCEEKSVVEHIDSAFCSPERNSDHKDLHSAKYCQDEFEDDFDLPERNIGLIYERKKQLKTHEFVLEYVKGDSSSTFSLVAQDSTLHISEEQPATEVSPSSFQGTHESVMVAEHISPETVAKDIVPVKDVDQSLELDFTSGQDRKAVQERDMMVNVNAHDSPETTSLVDVLAENIDQVKTAQSNVITTTPCCVDLSEVYSHNTAKLDEEKAFGDADGKGVLVIENDPILPTPLRDDAPQVSLKAVQVSPERVITGSPRKKLLVLDVNGLLVDVVSYVPWGYKPDKIILNSMKSVFKRPFCDDFLQFCFERFNVGVWSSRTKRNLELILDIVLENLRDKLLFCWDQSHCTDTGFKTVENRDKPLLIKKLRKLWEKDIPDLPWEKGEYNESNTLLLDDSPHKAICNPPYTAIFPFSYRFKDGRDNSLGPGGDLRVYLEGLAVADNVPEYVKKNPFGQRPVTEKNISWGFYSKVIEAASYLP